MNDVKNLRKSLKFMFKYLSKKPDENLIEGYKKAMEDYKESNNEQHLRAAEFIKLELDKRGIKVEDIH